MALNILIWIAVILCVIILTILASVIFYLILRFTREKKLESNTMDDLITEYEKCATIYQACGNTVEKRWSEREG